MIKGTIIGGDFSSILMRAKSGVQLSLGELLITEHNNQKFLLHIHDIKYSSELSQQNLEMVAGMQLEEGGYELLDPAMRMYTLAALKPLLVVGSQGKTCKHLPPFFAPVRALQEADLHQFFAPKDPLFLGYLRSGTRTLTTPINLPLTSVLSHHVAITASTGKGKSNLMSCLLWDMTRTQQSGTLVLDPHDEYYGRTQLGLKDHPQKENVRYYTPTNPPPGAYSLKINIAQLKPHHFEGALTLSDPQRQCLYAYFRRFKEDWVHALLKEARIEGVRFHEDTLIVVKRRLLSLLNLEKDQQSFVANGIFDFTAGQTTIQDICKDLEQGRTVIIDTSFFSGALEVMVASIIAHEIFERYKSFKRRGIIEEKPVISIVLEEAPRVLGKRVLEKGSNVFATIAREGRKFKIGLVAITQIPSEIPKHVLANMNTKIILGMEMATERQAVIESSAQDLSQDNRTIASLDKGEAIVTSTFTRFAVPLQVPLFSIFAKKSEEKTQVDTSFFG